MEDGGTTSQGSGVADLSLSLLQPGDSSTEVRGSLLLTVSRSSGLGTILAPWGLDSAVVGTVESAAACSSRPGSGVLEAQAEPA